jgi:hypothetical protein
MRQGMADDAGEAQVVPAQAGTQRRSPQSRWIPGGAGMTSLGVVATRRAVLFAVTLATALFLADPALAQPAGGPSWNQLSPQQREALAPLAGQWTAMPAENKRKWLDIADKYPKLSPEGKARLQTRMTDFSRLTPEQRRTARENFQRAYELPRESRESAVERYRSLPDDKKKELTERSQRKDAAKEAQKK